MGLPNNDIQAADVAIKRYGAAAVLQEILKQRPDLQERILELVLRVGIDAAVREIFSLQVSPEIEGPAPAPLQTEVPASAQGAQPKLPPAFKAAEMDVPQVTSGIRSRQGPAVELAVGGAQPQQISPGIQPEVTDVMRLPGEVDIPVSRTPAVAQAMPEAPSAPEAQTAPMPSIPSMDMVIPAMSEISGIQENFRTFVNETVDVGSFSKMCAKYQVPVQLALAVIKKESKFNPNAIGDDGELGLMQLMLPTARQMGLAITTQNDERLDPKKNIAAGLKYLSWLKRYKPKNVDGWLAGYNAGGTRIKDDKWKKIPSTMQYIDDVKKTVKSYQDDPRIFAADMNRLMRAVGGSVP